MKGRRFAMMAAALILFAQVAGAATSRAPQLDTTRIEELTGAKGKLDEKEGAFKVFVPRTDLNVRAAGVRVTPAMGLTSWASFQSMGAHVTVMGDMVLLENQVNPVMSVALDKGLEVTALHNHFLWETPRVMYMHVGGMGTVSKLAMAVGAVFAKIKETSADSLPSLSADIDPASTSLDPVKIEGILGAKGDLKDGVFKVTIGRSTRMHGQVVRSTMGVNTWAAFVGSDDHASVDGDFAMLEPEVQGVLKALRGAGINIVAIHQHMLEEQPRIVFLHYWGVGTTEALARGVRAALDRTRTSHP